MFVGQAKAHGPQLLSIGDDFSQTDVNTAEDLTSKLALGNACAGAKKCLSATAPNVICPQRPLNTE